MSMTIIMVVRLTIVMLVSCYCHYPKFVVLLSCRRQYTASVSFILSHPAEPLPSCGRDQVIKSSAARVQDVLP